LPISHPLFCHLHSSANKLDVSIDKSFGCVGDLFVAEIGTFVPHTGARQFTGYRVVRVDRDRGRVRPFVVNLGNRAEEIFDAASCNTPIDGKFQGNVLFVVDLGMFEPGLQLQEPGTGKVWTVARPSHSALRWKPWNKSTCPFV
jgi:hypothetical protein